MKTLKIRDKEAFWFCTQMELVGIGMVAVICIPLSVVYNNPTMPPGIGIILGVCPFIAYIWFLQWVYKRE